MNTVDKHIFGVHVAEEDTTFSFIIGLVDRKSSTKCRVFADDFTLSLPFIVF